MDEALPHPDAKNIGLSSQPIEQQLPRPLLLLDNGWSESVEGKRDSGENELPGLNKQICCKKYAEKDKTCKEKLCEGDKTVEGRERQRKGGDVKRRCKYLLHRPSGSPQASGYWSYK